MNASVLLGLAVALLCSSNALADVARDVRDGRQDLGTPDGGFIEFGPRLSYSSIPIEGADSGSVDFHVGGYYRFKRFFLDVSQNSHNRVQLGYNAYSSPLWSIDVLGASSEGGIDNRISDELADIDDRRPGLIMGLRGTIYSGPLIAQFEALADVEGLHDGFMMTGSIARNWLVRNWNAHAIIGARYYSAGYTDYIFGVDEDEASDRFPAYTAGASITYVTEIGMSYPLSEYLVLSNTLRYWALSDSIKRSPLLTDDDYTEIATALVFVF